MSGVFSRCMAHVLVQVGYGTTPIDTTPMDAAVNQGLGEVVEALLIRGVKCTPSHVSCKKCFIIYSSPERLLRFCSDG